MTEESECLPVLFACPEIGALGRCRRSRLGQLDSWQLARRLLILVDPDENSSEIENVGEDHSEHECLYN